MKHLQLHRHIDVLSRPKPKDQLIAHLHALGPKPASVIEICQLIHPLLAIFLFLELLEDFDLLIQAYVISVVKLILQHVTARILRCQLLELFIEFCCLHGLPSLDVQLTEGITNLTILGLSVICQQHNVPRILITTVDLIKVADGAKGHHASDPSPVDLVRDGRRLRVLSLIDQALNLFH